MNRSEVCQLALTARDEVVSSTSRFYDRLLPETRCGPMVALYRPKLLTNGLEAGSHLAYLSLLVRGYLSLRALLHPRQVVQLIETTKKSYPRHPVAVQAGRELWRDVIKALGESGYISIWGRLLLSVWGFDFFPPKADAVVEIRDQHDNRSRLPRHFPSWLEVMKPGDFITLVHADGGELFVQGPSRGPFLMRCKDAAGEVLTEAADVSYSNAYKIISRYIDGKTKAVRRSLSKIKSSKRTKKGRAWAHDFYFERKPAHAIDLEEAPARSPGMSSDEVGSPSGDRIVAIRFRGAYPPGSAGNEFAREMEQFVRSTLKETCANAVLLDLTELEYEWGDGIAGLAFPFLERQPSMVPVAIVAVPPTAVALQPLLAPSWAMGLAGFMMFDKHLEAIAYLEDAIRGMNR